MRARTRNIIFALIVSTPAFAHAQAVLGRVRDASGPWRNVTVTLTDARSKKSTKATTDSLGDFAIIRVPVGSFTLTVEKDGQQRVAGPFTIGIKEQLLIGLEMPESGTPVAHVQSNRKKELEEVGFYQRMATVHGAFITRDEFERLGKTQLTQVLSTVSGVRVVGVEGGRDVVLRSANNSEVSQIPGERMDTTRIPDRGKTATQNQVCHPTVFLNGSVIRHASLGDPQTALDDVESLDNIEAIEVYQVADAPPQFSGMGEACGAIVLWRKRS